MQQSIVSQLNHQVIALPSVSYNAGQFYCKRCMDLLLVTSGLVLLFPLLLLVALLVRLDSPGPVIYVQQRVGARPRMRNGRRVWEIRLFPFYKFRTMRDGADENLHRRFITAYIAGDTAEMAKLQHEQRPESVCKLVGDPRVTRMGWILRRTSLDELPQLWNVIKGDMSLVGPRPAIPYEVELYSQKDYQRLAATPGITGMWQISGRSALTFEDMVKLDLEYIDRQSLLLDLQILLYTIPAVLSRKGAD